jgi:hypothetical protein
MAVRMPQGSELFAKIFAWGRTAYEAVSARAVEGTADPHVAIASRDDNKGE